VDLPWVLAVRADDPLAGRPRVDAADLADVRLIRLPHNSTSGARLDAAFAEAGIRSRSDTGVADWDTALLLAELGLGHAVVPALPGRPVPGDGPLRLVPVPDLPPLSVGWAVRRWDALSPLARSFAETVAGSCRKRDADSGTRTAGRRRPSASHPPAAPRSGPPATAKSVDDRGRTRHDPSS
jgi:DNA-binding transcriptional LysR family regulator